MADPERPGERSCPVHSPDGAARRRVPAQYGHPGTMCGGRNPRRPREPRTGGERRDDDSGRRGLPGARRRGRRNHLGTAAARLGGPPPGDRRSGPAGRLRRRRCGSRHLHGVAGPVLCAVPRSHARGRPAALADGVSSRPSLWRGIGRGGAGSSASDRAGKPGRRGGVRTRGVGARLLRSRSDRRLRHGAPRDQRQHPAAVDGDVPAISERGGPAGRHPRIAALGWFGDSRGHFRRPPLLLRHRARHRRRRAPRAILSGRPSAGDSRRALRAPAGSLGGALALPDHERRPFRTDGRPDRHRRFGSRRGVPVDRLPRRRTPKKRPLIHDSSSQRTRNPCPKPPLRPGPS